MPEVVPADAPTVVEPSVAAASAPTPAEATTTATPSAGSIDEVLDVAALMDSAEDAILLQTKTFSRVIESPREVNAREFSLQVNKKRRIRMGIDLESNIQKTFSSTTLHYYSVQGYNVVRGVLAKCLPDDIKGWYAKVDGNPGFTKESLEVLQGYAKKQSRSRG